IALKKMVEMVFETIGPNSSAIRLEGVTRKRSIRPSLRSKIVLKPEPLPAPKAIKARMPGRKIWMTLLAPENAGPCPKVLSKGKKRTRYIIGVDKLTTNQVGLRSMCSNGRQVKSHKSRKNFMNFLLVAVPRIDDL